MALFEHEAQGISPSELTTGLSMTPSEFTLVLWNLMDAGVTERLLKSDRARISARMRSKVLETLTAIDLGQRQLSDLQDRYTRDQVP